MKLFTLLLLLQAVLGYIPVDTVETFGPEIPLSSRDIPDFKGVSPKTVLRHLVKLLPNLSIEITDEYTDDHNGVTHVWLRQIVGGFPVHNALGNVNIDRHGKAISNYDRFTTSAYTFDKAEISAGEALTEFLAFVGSDFSGDFDLSRESSNEFIAKSEVLSEADIPIKLLLHQNEDRSLSLAWFISVDLDDHWYEGAVDAKNGQVLSLHDLVHYYSYNVYPMGTNCPTKGPREMRPELFDSDYSPLGWHDQGGGRVFRDTQGNNVRAQENWSGNTGGWENNQRPNVSNNLFDFPINFNLAPRQYIDAATTNLFYHNNMIHDITYQYGFNEVSGNFQQNNFGRGGRENDPVTAHCQDGSGFNNANFATPGDGSPGRMRMYLWNRWNPHRDGDLASGIIYHEYAHGISNRLCGGPTVTGCLGGTQAGGMGEGWGDFFGLAFQMREGDDRNGQYGNSQYVSGTVGRNWPYSSDLRVAPQGYALVSGLPIHQIGGVWATMLYEIFFNLVEVYGFNADYTDASSGAGNIRIIQMVIDGMKFMPNRPTIVASRDAILDATLQTYDQETWCHAWCGFAKRGLGTQATSTPRNSCTVPAACQFCRSAGDVC